MAWSRIDSKAVACICRLALQIKSLIRGRITGYWPVKGDKIVKYLRIIFECELVSHKVGPSELQEKGCL